MERYDHASDALDQRFKPKPRTETSTLHKGNLNQQQPIFQRDDDAAKKLREWNEE